MDETVPQNTPTAAPTPASVTPAASGALDPKIVMLAQAIRQTESNNNFQAAGKSGEYGAYQFEPSTWNESAPSFGVNVPLQQATPEQQNEVAYKQLAQWSQQHPDWNIGNFASAWNAGAGKPNAYMDNNVGTNSYGVSYDTPAYAQKVATAYQQIKSQGAGGAQTDPNQTPSPTPTPAAPPSVGGFAGNVVSSGANFLGNTLDALIHPIRTVEGLGSTAAGGLQELGGQQNSNTAQFDNVVNYFKQRYDGADAIGHTVYTDPVGVAADLATVLGIGEGAVGAVGKASELTEAGRIGSAADIAASKGVDFIAKPDGTMIDTATTGNPITAVTRPVSSALGAASSAVNPLSPIIGAAGAAVNKLGNNGILTEAISKATGMENATIDQIVKNPEAFTPEEVANASRTNLAEQVKSALDQHDAALTETGSHYTPIKEGTTPIPVAHNFLEDQLRKEAKVDVVDGQIVAKGSSTIRDSKDVAALQQLFNTWKPEFQKGSLTPEEFLNFRTDLAKAAKFDREFSASKPVEGVTAAIRQNLNTTYRGSVPGLKTVDDAYSVQRESFNTLRKGILDKDGNLLDSAVNKIANSGGVGKDAQLARLEELVPGITKKIQVLKAIEDIQKSMGNKVGTYPSAILKTGGIVGGVATGNIPVIGLGVAMSIVADPKIAVPILRAIGGNKALISNVLARLAKFTTIAGTANRSNLQAQNAAYAQPDTTTAAPVDATVPTDTSSQTVSPQIGSNIQDSTTSSQ